MKMSKQLFLKIGFFSLIMIFGCLVKPVLAQPKEGLTTIQASRCEKFYKWFTIDTKKGATNAVEDLPRFCSVQQIGLWIINALLALAGSAALIFITYGGFRYVTSAGQEEASEQAKKILVNAVLGLAVIILAGAMVRIVANTLSIGKTKPSTSQEKSNSNPDLNPNIDENQELDSLNNVPATTKQTPR
jgi:amino acid transporter